MAEVTQSQFDLAFIRRSQEDHKLILNALQADGVLTIVDDPPEEAGGGDGEDGEGEQVVAVPSAAIEITVENVPEEETAEEAA